MSGRAAFGGAVAALLAWALFLGDGSSVGRLAWIGGAAFVLVALAATLFPAPEVPRAFLALLAAFVVWSGFSIVWSIAPDRSWDAFNRGLVYLAFTVLGLYAARLGTRAAAAGLAGLLSAMTGWALLGHAVPALGPDTDRVDRLRAPIGYWNVLAFLLAALLPLALWVSRRNRIAGALLLYGALVALLLTFSRAGLLVGLLGAGLWLLVFREHMEDELSLLALAGAGAAVVAVLDRDGVLFALALLAVGALVAAATLLPRRTVVLVAAAVVAVGLVAGLVRVGNPVSWAGDRIEAFANPPSVQRPQSERFSASSNNRVTWWKEAWSAFEDEKIAGTGAGSFELTHRLLRRNDLNVREPHSLALEALTETGLVGALLLAAAAGAGVLLAVGAIRRLRGDERAAAVALAAAAGAYLVHAQVDIHWSYVAASAPVFTALGVLAGAGRPVAARRPRGIFAPTAAALVAGGALYSLGAPALADHRVAKARDLIGQRDYAAAVTQARSARSLDPVSVEPLLAEGLAEERRGRSKAARRLYLDAVALQPENWRTWYELGQFEFYELEALDDAFLDLDKAYSLDPWGPSAAAVQKVRDTLEGR